ncbi:MAG: hypothetical protein QM752_06010 [Gammaproteobacteria bacterium]
MKLEFSQNKMTEQQFAKLLKKEINQEKFITIDFSYISDIIENWWIRKLNSNLSFQNLKFKLINIFLDNLKKEHIDYFSIVGFHKSNIAGVCIKNIFESDSPKLSLLVHESLSDLFNILDIKYDYEEHKTLYLKSSAEKYKNWGSGYGEIMPHADDLYEKLNVDYLSLTVCRDKTRTATKCFFPKNILRNFTDNELSQLKNIKAKFRSGKNVDIIIERERNIVEYSELYGFRFFLDFRIDDITGTRMLSSDSQHQILLNKMTDNLKNCPFETSQTDTGTFLIIANYKVLHAREEMKIEKNIAMKFASNSNLFNTPRLLYRSKGQRKNTNY